MLKFFKERQKRSQVRRELHALTDRELADIGISRGQIESVVRGDY